MPRSKATSSTEPEPKPKPKAKPKPKSRSASVSTSKIETGVESQDEEESSHPISKPKPAQSGSVSKSKPLHSTVSEIVGNRLKTIKTGRKDVIQAYLEPAAILNQLQFNQTKQLNDFLASRTSERNEIQRLVEIKREDNRNALRELVENSKRCNLWDQEDEDEDSDSDSESSSESSSSSSSSSSDSDSDSDDDDEDEEEGGARNEEEEEIHQPSVQEEQSKGKGKAKEIVPNEDDQMDLDESDKENQDQESREIEEVIPVPGRRVMKDQAVGEGRSKHPIKTGIGFLEYLAPIPDPGLTKKGKPRKIWPKKRIERKIQTLKIKIPKVRKKKKIKIKKPKKPKKPKKVKIEKPKSKKKLKAEAKEFKLIKNQAREEYRAERDKRKAKEQEEKAERKRLREEERERKRKAKEEGMWERRLDREDEMIRKKNLSQEEEEEEIKSLLKSQNPRHLDPTFYPPSLSNWPLLPDQVSRPEWSLGEDLSSVVEKEWRQRYRRELREQSKLERFRKKENANFNPVTPRSKSFQSDGNDSDSSTKTNSSSVRRSGRRRTSRHSSLAASDIFDLNEEERMEIEQSEDSDDSEIYEPEQNAVDDLDGEGPKQSKGKGKAKGTPSKRGSRSRSNSTSKTPSKKASTAVKRGKKRLRESEMEDSDLDWESDELDEDLELPKGFLDPIIPLAHSKLDSILYLLSKQTSEMIISVEDRKTGLNNISEEKGSEDEDDDDDDEIVDEGKLKKSISKKSKSRPLKSGASSIASGSSSAIESDSDSSSSSSSASSDNSLSPSESPSDEEQDAKPKGNFKSNYQNYPQNFKRGSNHRQIKSRASRWRSFYQSEFEKNKSNWGSNQISKSLKRQMLSYSWSLMTEGEKSQYGSLEEVQLKKMDLDENSETEQVNDKPTGGNRYSERPKNPKTPLRRYFENSKDLSTVDFNEDDVLQDWLALDPKEKSVYEKEYFKDFDEYQKELEIWLDNGGPQKEKEKDQARADQLEEVRVKQLRRADKPSKPMNAFSRYLLDRITEAKNLPRDERMKMSELIESSKRDWKNLPKDHRQQFETLVIQDQKTYTFKMIQWRRKWGAEYSLKGRLYTDENSKPSRPILRRDQWQKSIPGWDALTDLEKENLWQERHEQFLDYQKDHVKWKTGFLTEMSKIDVEQEAQSKWNQLKEEEKLGFESVIKEAILSMLDSDALRFKEIDHYPRSKPSLKVVQIRHLFTDHLKKVFEKRFEFKEVMKILNITNYEFHPIRIHQKLWKKLDLKIKAQLNQLAKERQTIHRIEMKEWERYHGNVDPASTSRLNNPIKNERFAPDRKLDFKDVVEIISRLERKDEKLGNSDLNNFRSSSSDSNVERVALLNTLERLEKIYGEGMEMERIKLRLEKVIQAEEIKKIATQVGEDQLWGGGVDVKEEEFDSRGGWKEEEMGMDLD